MNMVHEANENAILKWLVKYDSNLLLMHHRFPTSTINVKRAAHPFSTKQHFGDNQYILVHNGVIFNAEELYLEHLDQGIRYHSLLEDLTFNDSEALLWDFALYMEGKQPALVARGGIAFICLKLVKGKLEKMYFGRNTSPLNMLRTKEGISLSSEGEGEAITANTLHTWNYKLNRLTKKDLTIPAYAYNYGNYGGGYVNSGQYTPPKWDDEDDFSSLKPYSYPSWLPAKVAEKFDLKKKDLITQADIEDLTFTYLDQANGNFELAYWAIEHDYNDLLQDLEIYTEDEELRLQVRVLEKVLNYILQDPEYVNEDSISSEWRALWQQQQLESL